jgi:hypothetical protein
MTRGREKNGAGTRQNRSKATGHRWAKAIDFLEKGDN